MCAAYGERTLSSKMLIFCVEIIVGIGAVGTTAVLIAQKLNQYGVVTGILYVLEDSSAVVDGQIVYNGDMIYGVKVVRIEKSAVEFEKNGVQWKQRIQEKPNPAWKDSKQTADNQRLP
jgi:hypothetical protein